MAHPARAGGLYWGSTRARNGAPTSIYHKAPRGTGGVSRAVRDLRLEPVRAASWRLQRSPAKRVLLRVPFARHPLPINPEERARWIDAASVLSKPRLERPPAVGSGCWVAGRLLEMNARRSPVAEQREAAEPARIRA